MNKKIEQSKIELLIESCRVMEYDHAPDGYPAIQMRDVSMLCDAVENAIPSLDRLQDRLEAGSKISFQDSRWCLFDKEGEWICSGESIRQMLVNLIFVDC